MVGFEEELEDDFSEDVYAICFSRRFIVELWSLDRHEFMFSISRGT